MNMMRSILLVLYIKLVVFFTWWKLEHIFWNSVWCLPTLTSIPSTAKPSSWEEEEEEEREDDSDPIENPRTDDNDYNIYKKDNNVYIDDSHDINNDKFQPYQMPPLGWRTWCCSARCVSQRRTCSSLLLL